MHVRKVYRILPVGLALVCLFLAGVGGCDKRERYQRNTRSNMQAVARAMDLYKEDARILDQSAQFLRAFETRDLGGLKRVCGDADCAEYEAIMDCYYNAFVIENAQGVPAACSFLAAEIGKADASPARRRALGVLTECFNAKGSLSTREAAGTILILALEAKYPHRGGVIGALLSEKLGLMGPPRPATQPTTAPVAAAP